MSNAKLNVVQVIPIYYRTDEPANTVFSSDQETLGAVFAGRPLVLAIEEPLTTPLSNQVAEAVDSGRFKGLLHGDIPCLWIESTGEHFFWRLHRKSAEDIHQLFRVLRDAVGTAKSLTEVEAYMNLKTQPNEPAQPPKYWQNLLTLVVILAAMLGSFAIFPLTTAIVFALAVLIVAPVIRAFTQNAQSIKGKGLTELYAMGLQQSVLALKAIPKLFSKANGPSDQTPPGAGQ